MADYDLGMPNVVSIHSSKQGRRPHFIQDWAERRGYSQADLAREIEADKSIVSRWFSGSTPTQEYQQKLAGIFSCTEDALFRHPDDDWMAKFFKGRAADEVERITATLEAAFPRKTA